MRRLTYRREERTLTKLCLGKPVWPDRCNRRAIDGSSGALEQEHSSGQ